MAAPRHYIFFAIRPTPEAAERISRLAAEFRKRYSLTGQPVAPEHLHISLNFVGQFAEPDRQVIDRAKAAVAEVAMPPFVVALDRVGSWGRGDGPKPMVLRGDDGVIGANLLHEQIHAALARAGSVGKAEPQIAPHLTLLRDKAEAPMQFIDPVTWAVEEFVLLDSVRGQGRHALLGRWRLVR
jgi:2'-5' RNA ligase